MRRFVASAAKHRTMPKDRRLNQECQELNPGLQGEKKKGYLCAVPPLPAAVIMAISGKLNPGLQGKIRKTTSVLYCLPKIKQLRTNHYISGDEELVVEVEFLLLGI